MVAAASSCSRESGDTGAVAPVATGLSSGPEPIRYATTISFGLAPVADALRLPSGLTTIARLPEYVSMNGADCWTVAVAGILETELLTTTINAVPVL
jgi:hypothetical protein